MTPASTSARQPRPVSRWAPALLLLALGLGMVAPAHADRGWRGHSGGHHGYGWGGHHGYGWGGGGSYGSYGAYGFYGALPAFATVLTIGALTYWVADGIYYRAVPAGGYEVVPAPVGAAQPAAAVAYANRMFIYPSNAQSKEQQATDEYQCHQWAVGQTGFDPSLAGAAGPTDQESRQDYRRAQAACLDGRGYTVK